MRLQKAQKEAVLKWIAEGLKSDEINARAKKFKPPFSMTRQMVDKYRKTRKVDLQALAKKDEASALESGLAVRETRVARLNALGDRIWQDLQGDKLWLPNKKMLGSGLNAVEFDYELFNSAGVEAFRGILDDIAKEKGERKLVVAGDWREELGKLGLDADKVFEYFVEQAAKLLEGDDDDGGTRRGEETQGG